MAPVALGPEAAECRVGWTFGRLRSVVVGNDIGTFGNHRDTRILRARDAASDRLIEIADRFDPGQRTLFFG